MATRTQNAKRNIITSVINKLIIMFANFIMRTVLIKYMGEIYFGLDSLFVSILQILNLSELGISAALVYSMYKPIAEGDDKAVCSLLKLYRTVYRVIALIITVAGLALIPFLPKLIKSGSEIPPEVNLYLLYLIHLGTTVLSYVFFAYRSVLFTANQKYSINNNIYSAFKIGATIIQALTIILFRNYYVYCFVLPLEMALKNLAGYLLSKKMYPQYKCEGNIPKEEMSGIKKRVAGVFLYKVSGVFRNSFDNIVLSMFLGLAVVGQYNGYYYIINAISGIMILVSNSVTASVGNSIVTETKQKNYEDFKKIQLLYMWISSWLTVCLFACLQQFMELWVGRGAMFDDGLMIIFCIYFLTNHFSRMGFLYRQAAGLWWQDRYRPVVESLVNLGLNILLVRYLGVAGVMLSTIFCICFIDCLWGGRVLFKNYFTEEKQSLYTLKLALYLVLTIFAGEICYLISSWIGIRGVTGIIINVIIASVIGNAIFALGTSFLPEFKPSVNFALRLVGIKKRKKKSS